MKHLSRESSGSRGAAFTQLLKQVGQTGLQAIQQTAELAKAAQPAPKNTGATRPKSCFGALTDDIKGLDDLFPARIQGISAADLAAKPRMTKQPEPIAPVVQEPDPDITAALMARKPAPKMAATRPAATAHRMTKPAQPASEPMPMFGPSLRAQVRWPYEPQPAEPAKTRTQADLKNVEMTDALKAAIVNAIQASRTPENTKPYMDRIRELEKDVSTVGEMARNNRVVNRSINHLVEQYFRRAATENLDALGI